MSSGFCALVVAAGRGTRFGRPKQLIDIAGAPMIAWSLRVFAEMNEIAAIVVVTEQEWLAEVEQAATSAVTQKPLRVVAGGATRQASTFEGLKAAPRDCFGILVHDGARPLITAHDVRRAMAPVRTGHGALLAIPVVDTIKIVDGDLAVSRTLDRRVLWAAQTPQLATYDDMIAAHQAGVREKLDATDDAMLLEANGVVVHVVPGSVENFKVTLPEDQIRADHTMRLRLGLIEA